MRKLLIEILLVMLLVLASTFGMDAFFYNHINPVDYRLRPLKEIKGDIEQLTIGASHCQALTNMSIEDSLLTYNISLGGQDLYHSYLVLKAVIDSMTNLKFVIVELEYNSLGYNMSKFNQDWKDRQYYPYTGELYNDDFINKLMAQSSFFRSNRDFSFLLDKLKGIDQVPINVDKIKEQLYNKEELNVKKDFIPLGKTEYDTTACRKRAWEHSRIKFDTILINENLNILSNLINTAETYNLNILFLNTPKMECYRENYWNQNMQECKKMILDLFEQFGIKYYDYFDDKRFSATDFADYDHLNPGATKKLINVIKTDFETYRDKR